MKCGRSVWMLRSRFSPRSSSLFFFLIFASSDFLSAFISSHCRSSAFTFSCTAAIASRMLCSMCVCSARESRLDEIASRNSNALRRASRSSSSCPSRSYSFTPISVMSPATERVDFRSASLDESAKGVASPSSSFRSTCTRCALYRVRAILSSSLTALPSAEYRFFVLRLMRALPAMTCAMDLRKFTRSVSVSMLSLMLTRGSYRCTIQYNTSATSPKLGVRKFSTEIMRGYPSARMISVKSRSSLNDMAASRPPPAAPLPP
mmetsp:Transcript_27680/g.95762  ORF Transcript_27680/g.95762 Transcript_27680/m.95762 type:complete len:262 (+) Transcript_27680:293-1078(+)